MKAYLQFATKLPVGPEMIKSRSDPDYPSIG